MEEKAGTEIHENGGGEEEEREASEWEENGQEEEDWKEEESPCLQVDNHGHMLALSRIQIMCCH